MLSIVDAPNPLAVDLDDPDDIRAKLPVIADRLREKQEALDALSSALRELQGSVEVARRERDHWAALLAGFQAMVPREPGDRDTAAATPDEKPPRGQEQPSRATSVDIVVRIVNEAPGEMATRDVRQAAAPHDLADDTVSWALWKAASLGLIRRVKKGRYASLATTSEQPELAVSSNGTAPDETAEPAPDAGVQTQ
jgi:hypothetical protein